MATRRKDKRSHHKGACRYPSSGCTHRFTVDRTTIIVSLGRGDGFPNSGIVEGDECSAIRVRITVSNTNVLIGNEGVVHAVHLQVCTRKHKNIQMNAHFILFVTSTFTSSQDHNNNNNNNNNNFYFNSQVTTYF